MSFINVKQFAKKRGITIRGSWRTSRLRKKRLKHCEELLQMAYAEMRKKYYKKRNEPELPYIKGVTDFLGRPLRRRNERR